MEHDICSPSQLSLRFNCPGSVNLQKIHPIEINVATPKAERGIRLHAIEENSIDHLAMYGDDRSAVDWCFEQIRDKVTSRFTGTDIAPIERKEFRIDLSSLGISGGTNGCRIDQLYVIPGIGSIVIDKKFGVGYVSPPKYNWQMKAYAWGAWKAFGGSVECIILQPAAQDEEKRYQSHVFAEGDFDKIGADIAEIVNKTKPVDAPLIRGPHCSYLFCKCRNICPLWRNAVLEIPKGITVKTHLEAISPIERRGLYENMVTAQKWLENAVKTIQALAINDSLQIDGYEIGEGRKSYGWLNEQEAFNKIMQLCIDMKKEDAEIMEHAHLKSKSDVEKIIGKSKAARDLIDELIVEIPGNKCLKRINKQ
jgi:hypothetical protein